MGFLAKLKSLLCRYMVMIEFCRRCGARQPLVWWCQSDALWREVTGQRSNGIYCPKCFDRLALRKGITLRWLAVEEGRFTPGGNTR